MVESGKLLGPRVFASGNIIMSYATKYDFKTIHNNVDANRLINSLIKLYVHGPIKEYGFQNSLKRKWLKEASEINNIGITSHQTTFIEAISHIINGYSAIEHEIGSFPLQKDIIQLIGKSGINYTPTFMVSPGIYNLYVNQTQKEENKLSELNGDIVYRNYYSKHYVEIDESKRAIYENWNNMGMKLQLRAIKTLEKIVGSGVK